MMQAPATFLVNERKEAGYQKCYKMPFTRYYIKFYSQRGECNFSDTIPTDYENISVRTTCFEHPYFSFTEYIN